MSEKQRVTTFEATLEIAPNSQGAFLTAQVPENNFTPDPETGIPGFPETQIVSCHGFVRAFKLRYIEIPEQLDNVVRIEQCLVGQCCSWRTKELSVTPKMLRSRPPINFKIAEPGWYITLQLAVVACPNEVAGNYIVKFVGEELLDWKPNPAGRSKVF
jgi:hypothetical protein